MTQPTAQSVARSIREKIRGCGIERAEIAAAAGLTERQLRRRLSGEAAFKAHEVQGITDRLDRRAVALLGTTGEAAA
jgi:hypothetical protein